MRIGYARVSTEDQDLALQLDALNKAKCKKFYQEKITGRTKERPEFQKLLDNLRPKDVIIIWKLDRLGRSLKDLVQLVNEIQEKGAGLKSLHDNIDTTTPQGKLTFHIFAALAEFEADMIRERTHAGLKAARARGRKGGRPKGLSSQAKDKAMIAEKLYKEGKLSTTQICEHLSIARSTLYAYLRHQGIKLGKRD
jgi:DNA invertase Pin-like site-specific DNA recombinase